MSKPDQNPLERLAQWSDDYGDLGTLLRSAREHVGITQTDLARLIDTRQPAIAKWEAGVNVPTVATIGRIVGNLKLMAWIGDSSYPLPTPERGAEGSRRRGSTSRRR